MNNIIKKPVISEKSMHLTKSGMFTFIVDSDARKDMIKKAVEGKFNVSVLSVKTMNFKSETKQQRSRRGTFEIAGYKKAIVTLKQGQKIALFETESKEASTSAKAPAGKEVKEKKSLLRGTKVKIEKDTDKKPRPEDDQPLAEVEKEREGKK